MQVGSLNIVQALPQPAGRRFPYVAWLSALSPFLLLLVFITLGIHIRLGLGHWPAPVLEDYHTPAFHLHQQIFVVCMLFAVFGAGPLWVLCLFVPSVRPTQRSILSQFLFYGLGWLLIYIVLNFDPTSFSAWWLD